MKYSIQLLHVIKTTAAAKKMAEQAEMGMIKALSMKDFCRKSIENGQQCLDHNGL